MARLGAPLDADMLIREGGANWCNYNIVSAHGSVFMNDQSACKRPNMEYVYLRTPTWWVKCL